MKRTEREVAVLGPDRLYHVVPITEGRALRTACGLERFTVAEHGLPRDVPYRHLCPSCFVPKVEEKV